MWSSFMNIKVKNKEEKKFLNFRHFQEKTWKKFRRHKWDIYQMWRAIVLGINYEEKQKQNWVFVFIKRKKIVS
jgi:hypothetical protein